MSESKLIIPAIGKVLAKVETTSGTKESLASADAVFFEEIEWQYASDNLPRLPLAPERHGVRSVEGPTRITWSGSTEMAIPDGFNPASASPHPDVWLRACGFARDDYSASDDKVSLYILQSTAHESISFEAYEYTADGLDADYIQARGARCGWELSIIDGERVRLNLTNGLATEALTASQTYQASSSETKAVTYYTDKPFVANRGVSTVELVNLTNDDVYGGGTPGSPGGNFQIVSASFNGNMEPEEQRGLGAQRNRLGGAGPVTGTIIIEEGLLTNASAFDPYALRRDANPLEFRFKIDQNDASGDPTFFAVNAYLQIVGVNHTDAGKRRVWELEVEVKYPEDATDGDPAVGASPSQLFDHSTNNGLYVDVTPTNAGVGVFAITFYRDAS
jgi:hypothetical protein